MARRQHLWDDLSNLASSVTDAWAVIGDFNCTLSNHERRGGSVAYPHRDIEMFGCTLQDCDLIDARFQGDPYTWKKGNVEVRLDRCLINLAWRLLFQMAYVHHMAPLKSDHRPLLLCFKSGNQKNLRRRPFRFEAAWLTHADFPNVLHRNWVEDSRVWNEKVCKLQHDLKKWN